MATHRDAYIKALNDKLLVITSDNSANIGGAKQDLLAVDPYIVGRLTSRVAALEAVSLGASPIAASSTISFDYKSKQGRQITQGILDTLAGLGLTAADLTGSCETNFPAASTCLGITVISMAEPKQLLLHKVRAGDCCYLLGLPQVGQDVLAIYANLLPPAQVEQLTRWPEIHEVVPVGSQGIRKELNELARAYQLEFCSRLPANFVWEQSAGPATCILAVGELGLEERLMTLGQPVTWLGHWQ